MSTSEQSPDGFLAENVIELGAHTPSVDSVMMRLTSSSEAIADITAVVRWKNGHVAVVGNAMAISELALHSAVLENEVRKQLNHSVL